MARLQFRLALRLALRQLVKSPGSYLYAAVTLALGLGSGALLFSIMQGFTRPLPVPDGEDVLRVVVVDPVRGHGHFTVDDLHAWRVHARSFTSIGAVSVAQRKVATDRGDFYARVAHVTASVFPLVGVEPVFGRWPGESDAGAIVMGEDRWATEFSSDPAVLGRPVRLDGEVVVVVGVMPSGFRFPYKQTIWQVVPPDSPRLANGEAVVRLEAGISRTAASAEFTELLRASRTAQEGVAATATVRLVGFTEERGSAEDYAVLGAMLLVVLGLVLLSCSNVSALLLERNVVRARTLALHQAMGARPAQVALQVVVEALLVGGLGAILGAGVAHVGLRFLDSSLSANFSFYWTRLELDASAVAFAGVLGFVVALVSGALPSWRAGQASIGDVLVEHAQAGRGVRRTTLSWVLVNAQMAVAVAVVVAALGMATILVDRPWAVEVVDEFSADRTVGALLVLDDAHFDDAAIRTAVFDQLLSRVGALPGVRSAAISEGDWLGGYRARGFGWRRVAVEDQPFDDDYGLPILYVTPGFVDTFGLCLVDGRRFDANDTWSPGAADVAIVTERFVRERLPGAAVLGRKIRLDLGGGRTQDAHIVGVVSNLAVTEGQREHPREHVLLPISQADARTFHLTVRTDGLSSGMGAQVIRIAQDTAGGIVAVSFSFAEYARQLNDYLGRIPETLGVLAILGGTGCLLVAGIGIYGLVAFEMRQRLGEYAVRVALGARTQRLLSLVVRRVGLLVVPGSLVGFVFAWLGAPLLRVFGGNDVDVVPVFFFVFALYAVVVVVAAGLPALRVMRTNPARVLNS